MVGWWGVFGYVVCVVCVGCFAKTLRFPLDCSCEEKSLNRLTRLGVVLAFNSDKISALRATPSRQKTARCATTMPRMLSLAPPCPQQQVSVVSGSCVDRYVDQLWLCHNTMVVVVATHLTQPQHTHGIMYHLPRTATACDQSFKNCQPPAPMC